MNLEFCYTHDQIKKINPPDSLYLNIFSYFYQKNPTNIINKLEVIAPNKINVIVISKVQQQEDEFRFWYNTMKKILNDIDSHLISYKTLILNAPGELIPTSEHDLFYNLIIKNRIMGIIQALVDRQSKSFFSFCITYVNYFRMKIAIHEAYEAILIANKKTKLRIRKNDYNNEFMIDVIKLINKDLKLINNPPKLINFYDGFADVIQNFYYQDKRKRLIFKKTVHGRYSKENKQITLYLPALIEATTDTIDYHISIISTLIHEYRHHWQAINSFKLDDIDLPYKLHKEEIDAEQYTRKFLLKHKKALLSLIKKHFYEKQEQVNDTFNKVYAKILIEVNIDIMSKDIKERIKQKKSMKNNSLLLS